MTISFDVLGDKLLSVFEYARGHYVTTCRHLPQDSSTLACVASIDRSAGKLWVWWSVGCWCWAAVRVFSSSAPWTSLNICTTLYVYTRHSVHIHQPLIRSTCLLSSRCLYTISRSLVILFLNYLSNMNNFIVCKKSFVCLCHLFGWPYVFDSSVHLCVRTCRYVGEGLLSTFSWILECFTMSLK